MGRADAEGTKRQSRNTSDQLRYDGNSKVSGTAILEALRTRDFEATSLRVRQLLPERQLQPIVEQVLACLPDAIESIQIKTITGTAKDILDYDPYATLNGSVGMGERRIRSGY